MSDDISDSDASLSAATALTNREIEVLQLLASGMSSHEIANRLFVSLSTVKSHLSRIYAKLHVKNRTKALRIAYENGLLEVSTTRRR
jgi:DNA-binding NarL/FixJ family response regulator